MINFTEAFIDMHTRNVRFHTIHGSYILTPAQIAQVLIDNNQMCGFCYDTREIIIDAADGEGHSMRGVGTRTCALHD